MSETDGSSLLAIVSALANPIRLQIIAALDGREVYVSQLARDLDVSRPLLHMHLRKLEEVGLVTSRTEVSEQGKAMRFFQAADFTLTLSPATIRAAKSEFSNRKD